MRDEEERETNGTSLGGGSMLKFEHGDHETHLPKHGARVYQTICSPTAPGHSDLQPPFPPARRKGVWAGNGLGLLETPDR